MSNKHQFLLFALTALIGAGVVATALSMPPSRFDPVGTQKIMFVIGALVALLAAICVALAWAQHKQLGNDRRDEPANSLKSGAPFVLVPAALSALIINRVVSTEIVLGVVFVVIGALAIWVSPDLRFSRRTLGSLGVSAVVLTVGVTQLFQQVLGLPLP